MHYVYHPSHAPVVVSPEDYQKYLSNGWYDSPAKFPNSLAGEPEKEEQVDSVESAPKKKGRPPKVKSEEVSASVEL